MRERGKGKKEEKKESGEITRPTESQYAIDNSSRFFDVAVFIVLVAHLRKTKRPTTDFFAALLLSDEGISCCIMEIASGAASYTELHGAATCALNANDCNHFRGGKIRFELGAKKTVGEKTAFFVQPTHKRIICRLPRCARHACR